MILNVNPLIKYSVCYNNELKNDDDGGGPVKYVEQSLTTRNVRLSHRTQNCIVHTHNPFFVWSVNVLHIALPLKKEQKTNFLKKKKEI